MIQSHWKHTLGSAAVVSTVLLLSWACGGSSDGGSPTAPLTPVEVTGNWGGETTLESVSGVSGCGCISEELTGWIGIDNYTDWNMLQSGQAIEGKFWDDWGSDWCDFTGTLGMTSFSASSTQCEAEEIHLDCANGNQRDLVLESSNWQGTFSNDNRNIRGDWVKTWNCFKSQNGEAAGTLTQRFSFLLYR